MKARVILRGVCCIAHKFPLVATPDHAEYVAKCPLVNCPNGIKRFDTGCNSYYTTESGVVGPQDVQVESEEKDV